MYDTGRAEIGRCPRCKDPTIRTEVNGVAIRLSRFPVPHDDALILRRYRFQVVHVWQVQMALVADDWHEIKGPPDRGGLYVRHLCGGLDKRDG